MSDPKQLPLPQNKIPLPRALFIIFITTCLVSGSCLLAIMTYQHIREKQRADISYEIVAVVQTTPDAEGLKTAFLAEVLDLSVDRPKNLYSFKTKEYLLKLLQVPFIKEASIRKIRPGTIHVDYTLRKPIAYLGDYTNTAIDAEGTLFPFKPFFTPKKLPEIWIGEQVQSEAVGENEPSQLWGAKAVGEKIELAFQLLNLAPTYCDEKSTLCRIDVSRAFAQSDGQRQIILVLEDRIVRVADGESVLCIHPRILRLRSDTYRQQLSNYANLRNYLRDNESRLPITAKGGVRKAKATIIDMRLSDLAFFETEP